MVDYSIAAIPTEYRGRMYRSRLEARWAAFFDRLGLAYEYEPFDLGAWSPDFLLTDIDALVEVKPLTEFDADVWAKMVRACKERRLGQAVVLTRVAPTTSTEALLNVAAIGWAALPWHNAEMAPFPAGIGWYSHDSQPAFLADVVCRIPGAFATTSGETLNLKGFGIADSFRMPQSYTDHTMEQWARATADVQWIA